jgi:hypothetical protein
VRGTRRTSSPVDGVADRGANAGRDGRACEKREEDARRLLKPTGGGEEWGGGPAVGVPRGVGAAWVLAPTASRPTATRAQCARAARLCFGQGRAEAADGWARWQWKREGEERHERRAGARGPAREEKGVVKPR